MQTDFSDSRRIVGAKQSQKAIKAGRASVVYIAHDADPALTGPIADLCRAENVKVVEIPTMKELGALCSIQVGAAIAADIQ